MIESDSLPFRSLATPRLVDPIEHHNRVTKLIPAEGDIHLYGLNAGHSIETDLLLNKAYRSKTYDKYSEFEKVMDCAFAVLRKQRITDPENFIYIDEIYDVVDTYLGLIPSPHPTTQQVIYYLFYYGLVEYGGPEYDQVLLSLDKYAADNLQL